MNRDEKIFDLERALLEAPDQNVQSTNMSQVKVEVKTIKELP